ncbi:MAG: response regulator [Planctomycetaceae bacterium]
MHRTTAQLGNEMNKKLRVLFVDDDPAWLNCLKRSIRQNNTGWAVDYCPGGDEALAMMKGESFDVIVSDLNMPGLRGDKLLDRIATEYPKTLRFLLSGADASECSGDASSKAMEFIPKETAADDLIFRIARGVTLRRFMRGRVVDRLAEAISNLGDLPDLTMNIVNSVNEKSARHIEISCPHLGLEFRTMLTGSAKLRHTTYPADKAPILSTSNDSFGPRQLGPIGRNRVSNS